MRDAALITLMHSNSRLHDELKALRELMRLRDPKREVLFTAAMDVVEAFDDEMLALHTAAHFRESELSPLVQLLHAAGRHEAAMSWERFNETGDDGTPEPDDEAQDHTEPVTV
ncbi:hypothetical protein ACWDBP_39805 [Streptomyces sp. NPDC001233]|uniref:hypothetical protein n=1 Tax=Streptomyces sp. NPDC001127 TaxID=3154377 RepID=UPI003319E511